MLLLYEAEAPTDLQSAARMGALAHIQPTQASDPKQHWHGSPAAAADPYAVAPARFACCPERQGSLVAPEAQPGCPQRLFDCQWSGDLGCVNVHGGLMIKKGWLAGTALMPCKQQRLPVKASCTFPATTTLGSLVRLARHPTM